MLKYQQFNTEMAHFHTVQEILMSLSHSSQKMFVLFVIQKAAGVGDFGANF